jgi:hypothetical protein
MISTTLAQLKDKTLNYLDSNQLLKMKKKVVAEEAVVAEDQEEAVEEEVAQEEAMDLMRIEEEIIKVV